MVLPKTVEITLFILIALFVLWAFFYYPFLNFLASYKRYLFIYRIIEKYKQGIEKHLAKDEMFDYVQTNSVLRDNKKKLLFYWQFEEQNQKYANSGAFRYIKEFKQYEQEVNKLIPPIGNQYKRLEEIDEDDLPQQRAGRGRPSQKAPNSFAECLNNKALAEQIVQHLKTYSQENNNRKFTANELRHLFNTLRNRNQLTDGGQNMVRFVELLKEEELNGCVQCSGTTLKNQSSKEPEIAHILDSWVPIQYAGN